MKALDLRKGSDLRPEDNFETDEMEASSVLREVARLLDEYEQTTGPDERLGRLQHISQFSSYLHDDVLQELVNESLEDPDARIRGEMCYALGRASRPRFLPLILPCLSDPNQWVRSQAVQATQMICEGFATNAELCRQFNLLAFEIARLPEALALDRLVNEIASLREVLQHALPLLPASRSAYAQHAMDALQRNHRAYEQLEPELLVEHRGEFAVFGNATLLAVGPTEAHAVQKAMQADSTARLYIRRIGEELPPSRSGRR